MIYLGEVYNCIILMIFGKGYIVIYEKDDGAYVRYYIVRTKMWPTYPSRQLRKLLEFLLNNVHSRATGYVHQVDAVIY